MNPLRWPDAWEGDPSEIKQTTAQVETWMVDLITRQECLQDCEDCPDCDECKDCSGGTGSAFLWEEYMPCLDLASMLKMENGILYAKNDCCEWVAIGQIDAVETPVTSADLEPLISEGHDLSACGRAYAVWSTINAVADAIQDHAGDYLWSIIGNIKSASPVNLTTSGIWLALGQYVICEALDIHNTIDDSSRRATTLCQLAANMSATLEPLSDAEWSAIYSAYAANWSVLEAAVALYYEKIIDFAIGRDRLSSIAQAGALDWEAECDCPSEYTNYEIPTENGWYLLKGPDDIEYTNPGDVCWGILYGSDVLEHDIFGVAFKLQFTNTMGYAPQDNSESQPGVTSLWNDSSQPSSPAGQCASGDAGVLAEIFGFGNYNRITGGITWSTNPAAPNHNATAEVGFTWHAGCNVAGTMRMVDIYWICNINSPSHSA